MEFCSIYEIPFINFNCLKRPVRSKSMQDIYPPLEPFHTEHLKASPLHEIYVEQCGNPEGQPVLFLHGGPGAGCDAKHRQFFDPDHYRIILFDQRGCGRSKPHAELEENTTWDLVHDIELIRKHLGIRSWIVFGGSWGSTLALCYAIKHAARIRGLILRGIFLCSKWEIQWFYQEGASNLFPELWETFLEPIPVEKRGDMVKAYHELLTHPSEAIKLKAAKAWSKWEGGTSKLLPDEKMVTAFDEAKHALEFARIENHYFTHNIFVESDTYILDNIAKIRSIPCVIVHGRYDVVCPVRNAWELHKRWPEAQLHIIPDAGHSVWEKGILEKIMEATEAFKGLPSDL